MTAKTVSLIAPNGAKVTAASEKRDELLRRGFTEPKASASKAASSKSKKS